MTNVSDILRDRRHEPQGLQRMVMLSIAVHAVAMAALLISPPAWYRGQVVTPPRVMTITLGGGSGPANGGMTAMGGRPVQTEAPPVKQPEAVRPPAAKAPEMTLPTRGAKPLKQSTTAVKQAPDDARGKTPTKGAEVANGSTVALTGARGQGFGLSSGGGGGGMGATLDVADFCCPDYLVLMADRIRAAWNQQQGSGLVVVRFTIQRDGRLTDSSVERSSGNPALDLSALSSIVSTKQIPPLPSAFPNSTLTVHLNFEYHR